jgi:dihydroorotate dehydrogenase
MFSILRPYIFNLDPETAHNLAIKSLKLNLLPENLFRTEDENLLNINLFNKDFKNPIGLAAGFDKSAEVYNPLFKIGFGFIEVGTITPKPQFGNPKPRVFRLERDKGLINRLGFNNDGAETVKRRFELEPAQGVIGINVGPNKTTEEKSEDYLKCIELLHSYSDYITINISSPNTENLRKFHEKENLIQLLEKLNKNKVENKIKKPFFLKISPDINGKEISYIIELTLKYNIYGIIVSNTTDENREKLSDENKIEKGGLSGKPINQISTKLITKFYNESKGKLKIIGVGGVDSGKCVFEKMTAGASLVQLYTGLVYKGPGLIKSIKKDLIDILKKEKISKVSDIIGKKTVI